MISGIILGSGFSKRMKTNKLIIEVDGTSIIERVINAAKESLLDEIILVYRTEEIKKIGEKHNIKTLYNANAHLGQSESVKLGIKESGDCEGYMFLVGDQPFLNKDVIDRLIKTYRENPKMIVVPFFNNAFGMPIIFPSYFKEDLLKIQGDKGGREIIQGNPHLLKKVHFRDEILGFDVDTIEDLNRINNKERLLNY